MSKPDWKDAPEGFDWLAMDEGGTWFWYSAKPKAFNMSWVSENGEFDLANGDDVEGLHWRASLEHRP